MKTTNEDDNRFKILFYLLLAILALSVVICTLKCIEEAHQKPQNATGQAEQAISVISAVPSPMYAPKQLHGSYLTIDSQQSTVNEIDRIVESIILCESGGNNNAVGDNGRARGVGQFWRSTFDFMKAEANNPFLDYYSEQDQRWLLKWALNNGYASHWTCATKLGIA